MMRRRFINLFIAIMLIKFRGRFEIMDKELAIKIRNQYQVTRDVIGKQIEDNNREIAILNNRNSDLEKTLEKNKPRLECCDKNVICEKCDIYSMKHKSTIPGHGERTFVYNCIICNYEATDH